MAELRLMLRSPGGRRGARSPVLAAASRRRGLGAPLPALAASRGRGGRRREGGVIVDGERGVGRSGARLLRARGSRCTARSGAPTQRPSTSSRRSRPRSRRDDRTTW